MHFGNSAGNFGGSAVRQPVGHDSAAAMSKLVALLPNYMEIVQNWSEKGVYKANCTVCVFPSTLILVTVYVNNQQLSRPLN